eukprot:m.86447 g.86447  ORF g.86447 m.86447 type:complete len:566 (+) comp14877_c0_seq1:33-1730(+)
MAATAGLLSRGVLRASLRHGVSGVKGTATLAAWTRPAVHASGLRHNSTDGGSSDGHTMASALQHCEELLNNTVLPMNRRLEGPLRHEREKATRKPFVLLVGNHSSGKSSFINFIMGRQIQDSGLAPTDDSFTVVLPGANDLNQDANALMDNQELGFFGLQQFGEQLIPHLKLKVRSDLNTNDFAMVDSPGMIDTPVTLNRGYDFEGVVKWFAERADVIMLFFDPEKPGTTSETLSVLTTSLQGMEHKLSIILNKADQFTKIHDFARAYGALCWNLSKVIQRKDLPKIYTMCLPTSPDAPTDGSRALHGALKDLSETREAAVAEVFNAPKRRIDNVITRLRDSCRLLLVHIEALNQLQSSRKRLERGWYLAIAAHAMPLLGVGGAIATEVLPLDTPYLLQGGAAGTLLVAISLFLSRQRVVTREARLASEEHFNHLFLNLEELAENKYQLPASMVAVVKEPLKHLLAQVQIAELPVPSREDVATLERIHDETIPELRNLAFLREASPELFKEAVDKLAAAQEAEDNTQSHETDNDSEAHTDGKGKKPAAADKNKSSRKQPEKPMGL